MKMRQLAKKGCNSCLSIYDKVIYMIYLMLLSTKSFADTGGIIPISTEDQTGSNSDFAATVVRIFQKGILPIIMLAGATWVIWTGIATIAEGVKDSQELKRFGPLKDSIIKTVIVVVVGGALLYLLNRLRTFQF